LTDAVFAAAFLATAFFGVAAAMDEERSRRTTNARLALRNMKPPILR
jgi:hypothetical protein